MTIVNEKRLAFVNKIRERYPEVCSLALMFGPLNISVTANKAEIIDGLKDYFKQFVVDSNDTFKANIHISAHEGEPPPFDFDFTVKRPDPGKTKIKEESVDLLDGRIVRKRLTGMFFVFGRSQDGSADNVVVGPCLKNLNQVVNFVNNRHIEWSLCRGSLLGHAAGVIINGVGIAAAGFSGAGKSTFALHLMSKGATFVSNDRLMIEKSEKGLIMHGVAKLPRINPGTILNNPNLEILITDEEKEKFLKLPKEELWNLEYKYDAPIDTCFGNNRFVLTTPMFGLVILNWKHNDAPMTVAEVDIAERRDLLPAFMKESGLFFRPEINCKKPPFTEESYIEFLKRCKVWEISGGVNFEKAVEACRSIVSS